jgi:hypothetical protein
LNFYGTVDEAFWHGLTVYMVDKMNAECNLHLQKPPFVQSGLFDQFANAGKNKS